MHRDIVPRYPLSVEKLGYSTLCDAQGFYVKNRLISLQGHPEYNAQIAVDFLQRRRGSKLDEQTYADGIRRAHDLHDGAVVGAAFVKFLLEE